MTFDWLPKSTLCPSLSLSFTTHWALLYSKAYWSCIHFEYLPLPCAACYNYCSVHPSRAWDPWWPWSGPCRSRGPPARGRSRGWAGRVTRWTVWTWHHLTVTLCTAVKSSDTLRVERCSFNEIFLTTERKWRSLGHCTLTTMCSIKAKYCNFK